MKGAITVDELVSLYNEGRVLILPCAIGSEAYRFIARMRDGSGKITAQAPITSRKWIAAELEQGYQIEIVPTTAGFDDIIYKWGNTVFPSEKEAREQLNLYLETAT